MIYLITAYTVIVLGFSSTALYMYLNNKRVKLLVDSVEKLESQLKEVEKRTSIIRR